MPWDAPRLAEFHGILEMSWSGPGCIPGFWGELTPPVCLPRFSHMIQDKALRTSWARKMKERQEKKLVQELARQLEEAKQREKEVTGLSWRIPVFPNPMSLPSSWASELWQNPGKGQLGWRIPCPGAKSSH